MQKTILFYYYSIWKRNNISLNILLLPYYSCLPLLRRVNFTSLVASPAAYLNVGLLPPAFHSYLYPLFTFSDNTCTSQLFSNNTNLFPSPRHRTAPNTTMSDAGPAILIVLITILRMSP